jgi:hypothetical protein
LLKDRPERKTAMFCKQRSLGLRVRLANGLVPPLCLLLSACGGGGSSGVASIPPPPITPTPTPTPTGTVDVQTSWLDSPATRAGKYDLIGRLTLTLGNGGPTSFRALAPGEFSLTVAKAGEGFSYALGAPAGILPAGSTSLGPTSIADSWTFNVGGPNYRYDNPYADYVQYFGQNLKEYELNSDGTKKLKENYDFTRASTSTLTSLSANTNLRTNLDYDVGYSYVAMGEWSWRVVDLNGTAAGDFGDLLFVNGDRTPASGIPASGTATYDAHSLALLSSNGTPGIPFTLTADFGLRTMSTRIDQDYKYNVADVSGDPILGIHVGGSAPFSDSGTFDIPLAGTANYSSTNSPVTPPSEAVAGMMNGAFFGPNAQQVGGVFSIIRPEGILLMQDAFVGQQTPR